MKLKQYLNPSLSCPDALFEITEDNQDEMKIRGLCPYCGKETTYGQLMMCSGFVGCPNCYEGPDGLMQTVMRTREKSYGDYLSGNFYLKGYRNWKVKK